MLARKTIKFNELSDDKLRNYPAILFYNSIHGDEIESFEKYATPGSFLLLSPFSLTAVKIAIQLNKKNPPDLQPQLFMIDHGLQPALFWAALKRFFSAIGTRTEAFPLQLESFLKTHIDLYAPQNSNAHDEVRKYHHKKILDLIDQNGYDCVRDIIINAHYLKQDWKDEETFQRLEEYIASKLFQKVIVYASNIVAVMRENIARQILENIYSLRPTISIHQNNSVYFDRPDACRIILKNGNVPEKMFALVSASISLAGRNNVQPFSINNQVYINRQAYFDAIHATLETHLLQMQKQQQYIFNHHNSPLLLDVIFNMAGIKMTPFDYKFQSSEYTNCLIFHVRIPESHVARYLAILQKNLPHLGANFAHMGEAKKLAQLPISISLNSCYILDAIVPRIPEFLQLYTPLKSTYEYYAFLELIDTEFSRLSAKDNFKIAAFGILALAFLPLILTTGVAFAYNTQPQNTYAYIFSLVTMLVAEANAAYQFANIYFKGHHRFANTPLRECTDELNQAARICHGECEDTTTLGFVKATTLDILQRKNKFFKPAEKSSPHIDDSKPWRYSL